MNGQVGSKLEGAIPICIRNPRFQVWMVGDRQFFFCAAVESVTIDDLQNLVQTYRTAEIQGLKFLTTEEANTLIGKSDRAIQAVVKDRGLSEELRMNLKLAIDHIDNSGENE